MSPEGATTSVSTNDLVAPSGLREKHPRATEKDLMSNKNAANKKPPIQFEDGLIAARIVHDAAKREGKKVALCGGLALHFYGFTRATRDIDLIGQAKLHFKELRKLNFGGVAYGIDVHGTTMEVDLILRSDDVKELYDLALENSKFNPKIGLHVITPEYLVILKYLSGRGKDQIDLMWLLREEKLVNRKKVKSIITKQMGKHSYWAIRDLDQLFLEADLLKARDEKME
jgi:hypothetical protein